MIASVPEFIVLTTCTIGLSVQSVWSNFDMNSVSLCPNDLQLALNCTAYAFLRRKSAVITRSMGRDDFFIALFLS